MIQIDTQSLEELEYLLTQSTKGLHLLFNHSCLADILKKRGDRAEFYSSQDITQLETLLGNFLKRRTYIDKISFLDGLNSQDYEVFVQIYFDIVENAILASQPYRH